MRSLLALPVIGLFGLLGLSGPGCSDSTPASSGGGTPGDAGACGSSMDCVVCCNEANEAANEAAVGYVIRECVCKDDKTPCAGPCGVMGNAICSEPGAGPSDECVACINGELDNPSSACVGAADKTCDEDEACAPLLFCLRGCP
ncbi:MAG: hypothetical protein U0359_18820 [Byssovorax sp.]